MVIVMHPRATEEQIADVLAAVQAEGLSPHCARRGCQVVIGLFGANLTPEVVGTFEWLDGVAKVVPIAAPYKRASREFQEEDSVVRVGEVAIGGRDIVLMAGPCAVEGRETLEGIATIVRNAGGSILRGGAFDPLASPYAFQGFGETGLRRLRQTAELCGLPIAVEVLEPAMIPTMTQYVDLLQVAPHDMQNVTLLRELGKTRRPVMLQRGPSATLHELLLAAEYIMAGGNHEVILCERGTRGFGGGTLLDVSAVALLKKLSHLPVVVDVSHATGQRELVMPAALGAVAAGADGLVVEVHSQPDVALCDAQSLLPEQMALLGQQARRVAQAVDRSWPERGRITRRESFPETNFDATGATQLAKVKVS
jgi:3-deoxy-7-phosphoheptulonate synthase